MGFDLNKEEVREKSKFFDKDGVHEVELTDLKLIETTRKGPMVVIEMRVVETNDSDIYKGDTYAQILKVQSDSFGRAMKEILVGLKGCKTKEEIAATDWNKVYATEVEGHALGFVGNTYRLRTTVKATKKIIDVVDGKPVYGKFTIHEYRKLDDEDAVPSIPSLPR